MHTCMRYQQRPESNIESPRAGVTGSYEPPTWVVGMELRSSGRTSNVLKAEPSLQPESLDFKFLELPETAAGQSPCMGAPTIPGKKSKRT